VRVAAALVAAGEPGWSRPFLEWLLDYTSQRQFTAGAQGGEAKVGQHLRVILKPP
jgi:hypothetical protein